MKLFKDGALLRAAVVLFGRVDQIESDMPQCRLRVARFKGVDRTAELLDNRQFFGNAFTLLSVAERFLRDVTVGCKVGFTLCKVGLSFGYLTRFVHRARGLLDETA